MADQQLFREEALEARREAWLGSVSLALPVRLRVWSIFFCLLGCVVLLWLGFGQYTRREHVTGVLVPKDGLLESKARVEGVVSLHAKEGDAVKKGDLLLAIANERVSRALGNTSEEISRQLGQQRDQLDADLDAATMLQDRQADGLSHQLDNLRQQLEEVTGQLNIQEMQSTSNHRLLDKIKPLADHGYVSVFQVQQQEMAALSADAQLKGLRKQRLDVLQAIHSAQDQLSRLPFESSARIGDLKRQRAQILQNLSQNEAERAIEVRAEQEGTISSMLVRSGQSVISGQPLLTLVPNASPLQAQLLVPSTSIGFIKSGQTVAMRLQAYPYQKFGIYRGHIASVSSNALSPTDLSVLLGQSSQEPYYRVMVDMDSSEVEVYGERKQLRPGMALDADIMLDRRKIYEWVFEPLFGFQKKASAG